MQDNNEKARFTDWYEKFLIASGDKSMTQEMATEEAERVAQMLPDEYRQEVSCECELCSEGEDRGKAEYFGLTDLGNAEPEKRNNNMFGNKGGTVLPVVVSSCKRCRRNYMIVEYIPTIIFTLFVLATLIIVNLQSIRAIIFAADGMVPLTMRPFFIFAIEVAVAILLSVLLRKLPMKCMKTNFNILKLSRLKPLSDSGWFKLNDNKHFSEVLFAKALPEYMQVQQDAGEMSHTCNCGCEQEGDDENKTCNCGCEQEGDEENKACNCGCEQEGDDENKTCDCGCEQNSDDKCENGNNA